MPTPSTTEIDALRRRALVLRVEAGKSAVAKRYLELALADLDDIPQLFESEEARLQALRLPAARIVAAGRILDAQPPASRSVRFDRRRMTCDS